MSKVATNITKGTGKGSPALPLISVVIPCFNDGIYLGETLEKLRKQTFTGFEVIIVNDGSTDEGTLKVLGEISGSGAATVLHKTNGRMSSARNYGVLHARGSIIAALDADDYFHPGFFQKGLALLAGDDNLAVVSSYIQLFGEYRKVAKPRGGSPFNLLFSSQIPACALVRKRCWDEIGGYDENMRNGYEDWEFYIRIFRKGWTIHVIKERLFFYRQTKKSTLVNDTGPNRAALISYIVDKHKDWYLENIKVLMTREQVLYTEARISYQRIFKMIIDRLRGKY
jgi:glycosyltransferase involved in cell wall biosynthesis